MNLSNSESYALSQGDRARLFQILNELGTDQLRLFLTKHSRSSISLDEIQQCTRAQAFHECFVLLNGSYSPALEQSLISMKKQNSQPEYGQLQPQSNFRVPYSHQQQVPLHTSGTAQYKSSSTFMTSSPAITQQLQTSCLNSSTSQSSNSDFDSRPQQAPASSTPSLLSRLQSVKSTVVTTVSLANTSSAPSVSQYQTPILPSTSYSSSLISSPNFYRHTPILSATNNSRSAISALVTYKSLPFYHMITRVYERLNVFNYDNYRKQYSSYDEFILPLDACNQLSMSYDYDPKLNIRKTSKCLLLRLARIDQPPTCNGSYEDNLPPNLMVQVNGHNITTLPAPKPCPRQQTDLIRIGREIDITPHAMFNPILKNEIKITWSLRQENVSLHLQFTDAQYALHIFLAQRLTVEDLCEQITKKIVKFNRQDSMILLARACSKDRDLDLEVSDQKLRLCCPIDQRRMRKPIRATSCQHLQCFDLTNYIALNEKSNKWICPVCNKPAFFEDLQIDAYIESILSAIKEPAISEITINSDLMWAPVIPSKPDDNLTNAKLNKSVVAASCDFIFIDDD